MSRLGQDDAVDDQAIEAWLQQQPETTYTIQALANAPYAAIELGRCLFIEWFRDFQTFCGMTSGRAVADDYRRRLSRPVYPRTPTGNTINAIVDIVIGSGCSGCSGGLGFIRLRRPPRHVAFVATQDDNGRFVGTASIDAHDMRLKHPGCPKGALWLANVYVAPAHREMGIGRALVKHAIDYARHALKARELWTWTFPNDQLLAWYRSHGFVELYRVPKHGTHTGIVVLRLPLATRRNRE